MNQSESSDLPFDERRKQKPKQALHNLVNSVEESSQATETTATATISTLLSFSESKVTQRQRHAKNNLLGQAPQSDSKLAGLRKELENLSPRRLFQDESAKANYIEEDEGEDAALSTNDDKSSASVSLPQEQMNELLVAHSESTELIADTQHLRYLREKVDRQVQSMSKLLLETPADRVQPKRRESTRPPGHEQDGSMNAAAKQFQALSSQVLADFLDRPKQATRISKRRQRQSAPTLQFSDLANLELMSARREIEELRSQLTDQEQANSLSQADADPQVLLLHQQRSKLQRRIRELLHETAELRQERNSFEMQCLEQSRRIHSLEDTCRQLEEEKKDSEKGLYRYISALQDKSTQLLEELQETRRILQHESRSRMEASMEAKHRIAALETERKRLQKVVSRNLEEADLVPSKEYFEQEDDQDQSMIPDQPVISNMEAIAGNDRIQKMRSEVQQRRAKIEAIRRKRTDEQNQSPKYRNHAPSPVGMIAYSPSASGERNARSPMSFDGISTDHLPGMQQFLQRIEDAMEEGATLFANENSAFHLQQELLDMKHENLQLKLEIKEAEQNATALESTAKETLARLQEAADREENLTKELNEQRAKAESAKTELEKQENVLQKNKQELEERNVQLSEIQKECLNLKEHAKEFQGLEHGESNLQGVIESRKAQNRAMSSQIDSLEMTVVDLEMANGSLKDYVLVLGGDLKQKEGLVAKLSADLSASSGREASTREELETALQEKNALQSKITIMVTELEESQKKRDSLEQNVKQLESTVSAAEEKQLVMKKKFAASETALTSTKKESGKLAEELETIHQAMKNLRTEKGAQAMALKHAEQVQNELASRLAAAELDLKEQTESSIVEADEVSRLLEKCLGVKSDASTISSFDLLPDTPRSQERQVLESKLKLEFAETSERRGVLERKLRDLQSQFLSLREGEETSGWQPGRLGRNLHLRSLDTAIGRLRTECDELALKNTSLQDQNDAMKELVSDSEKLRKELEKIISEREKELETLRENNVASEANAVDMEVGRKKLAEENEIYVSIQGELETRLAEATRLLDLSLPRIEELEAKVEELNTDVAGRDVVVKEMDKKNASLTQKVKTLSDAVEFWVKKCTDLESAEARKEASKSEESSALVTKVTEKIQKLSDVKAEVMEQLFRTAGGAEYQSHKEVFESQKADASTSDVLADIQDLHYVLDTVRQFIVASREATTNLDRTIESLRDEKSLLVARNAALERIIEEQRVQSNEFEKLLSTMRVIPSQGSVGSYSVAVQSRATQTEPENVQSTGTQTEDDIGEQVNKDDEESVGSQELDGRDDGTGRPMSPISEINSYDDNMTNRSWTDLSEVDSKNDSMKQFPPCDDISDLSQTSTLGPSTTFVWKGSEENTSYSLSVQPPSTQLENIAAAESFQELRTPRVSNSAHPDRIGRQQQPPEYSITLGALATTQEPSPVDRYAIEESSEFGKKRTKSFDFV